MCRCLHSLIASLEAQGYVDIEAPVELGGRLYLEFKGRKENQKKAKIVPFVLDFCPICGKNYDNNEEGSSIET